MRCASPPADSRNASKSDARAFDLVLAECDGKIPPPEQGAHPRSGLIGVSLRRRIIKRRVPHALEVIDDVHAAIGVGAGGAQSRNRERKWPFEFVATSQPEPVRLVKRAQSLAHIPGGFPESVRHSGDGGRGRIVRDKMTAKLGADVERGGWMGGNNFEHAVQFVPPAHFQRHPWGNARSVAGTV